MEDGKEQKCGNCMFFLMLPPPKDAALNLKAPPLLQGLCRRYPPQLVNMVLAPAVMTPDGRHMARPPLTQSGSSWPPVLFDQGCGEFRPKDQWG